MAKSKEISSKNAVFAKGGSNKMFGKQYAGTQKPGVTGHEVGGGDGKFAQGGKTNHMAGPGVARPAKPGVTASN